VLLEAMALGVPVVARRSHTKDVLKEGRPLYRAGRRVRICSTLLPLLADRAQPGHWGGRRTCGWSETRMQVEILQLYQSLVSPNAAARGYAVSVVP
jgi:hypothetical protein